MWWWVGFEQLDPLTKSLRIATRAVIVTSNGANSCTGKTQIIRSPRRCGRAGPGAPFAPVAACDYCLSTLGTEARWSTQSCCERVQIWDLGISCSRWRTVPTRMK
jgi:hypothetical protein